MIGATCLAGGWQTQLRPQDMTSENLGRSCLLSGQNKTILMRGDSVQVEAMTSENLEKGVSSVRGKQDGGARWDLGGGGVGGARSVGSIFGGRGIRDPEFGQ